MRVYRARPQSGLLLSFSLVVLACGNPPGSGVATDKAGQLAPGAAKAAARASMPQDLTRQQQLASAAVNPRSDRTLAPYFFVDNQDGTETLPLKSTRASVHIAGAIADVQVTQIYKNQGKKPIEAVYLFPASTRAAVHAMKMTIGQRVIEAQVRERDAARRDYETARAQGRTATLLEQQRPNVFQMNVANILPGDELKVELRYAELLVPEHHIYEFVYPTTVGPRYSNTPASQAQPGGAFVNAPSLPAGTASPHTFALDADLQSAVPIQAVAVPTHKSARITQVEPAAAHIALPAGDDVGNRDFVLRYSLEGEAIDSGLMIETGAKENYFLFMMQPPARVESSTIVPREYIFVVDVSGSMNGFPLDVGKKLMQRLMEGLRPQDKFNILSFAGGSALLSPSSLRATPDNVNQAMHFMKSWEGGGGTELLPALRKVRELPRSDYTSRTVVVITDGYVDVEKDAFALIGDTLGDTNVFAFGIGSSVNRFLIEGMARAGQGEPFIVLNEAEAQQKAGDFLSYIRSPVLQGVKVRFEGFDAYDVEPAALPDLFSEKPIVVQGKYRGAARGQVVVSGHAATGAFAQTLDVAGAARSSQSEVLGTLWARTRIQRLSDRDHASPAAYKSEITALGLEHHLLTSYTSFIAVDSAMRAGGEKGVTVHHPSPMPQGVSNLAVGAASAAGVLGILHAGSLGGASALGQDSAEAMGGLVGTEVGDAYGAGGMGLVGSGRGGGGPGGGTIGLGVLGPIGRGSSGSRAGTLSGRRGETPTVLLGTSEVRGWLNRDLIMRIIRRHLPEVRFCYERELIRSAELEGRLIIQLTVGGDGAVIASIVKSSTLGNPLVEQCIANAIRRWDFPKPQGGIVVITTPFVLKSGGA